MNYAAVHRHHMAHELERQDKEWRRLNVRKKGALRVFWEEHGNDLGLFLVGIALLLLFSSLIIGIDGLRAAR